MTESGDPRAQAAAARELAARARRLAHGVGEGAERTRLLQYAEELEEHATRLDAQAPDPDKPQVEQQQQQMQQQGPSGAANDPSGRKKPR
jgi:hypothetical protein